MAINPEYSTAVEISRLVRFPILADNIETFYRGRVELVGFHAQEDDFIVGQPLLKFSAQCAMRPSCSAPRSTTGNLHPQGSSVFISGDRIYVIGDFISIPHFSGSLGRIKRETQNIFHHRRRSGRLLPGPLPRTDQQAGSPWSNATRRPAGGSAKR